MNTLNSKLPVGNNKAEQRLSQNSLLAMYEEKRKETSNHYVMGKTEE